MDKDGLTARAERVTDLPPAVRPRLPCHSSKVGPGHKNQLRNNPGQSKNNWRPPKLAFCVTERWQKSWWHRCFVLPQRSKADQHQFLCSPLGWAFSIPCSVHLQDDPRAWPRPVSDTGTTQKAESRGLGRGVSFSKSQTAAIPAGMAKKPKEKKGASLCSSSSDAELVNLPGLV